MEQRERKKSDDFLRCRRREKASSSPSHMMWCVISNCISFKYLLELWRKEFRNNWKNKLKRKKEKRGFNNCKHSLIPCWCCVAAQENREVKQIIKFIEYFLKSCNRAALVQGAWMRRTIRPEGELYSTIWMHKPLFSNSRYRTRNINWIWIIILNWSWIQIDIFRARYSVAYLWGKSRINRSLIEQYRKCFA